MPNHKSNVTRTVDDEHYGDQDYDDEENWDYGPGYYDAGEGQESGHRSTRTTVRDPSVTKADLEAIIANLKKKTAAATTPWRTSWPSSSAKG